MARVDTKEAHKALKELLKKLKKLDLTGLQRKPLKDNPGALSTSVDQWEQTLERAVAEIPEWCVSFSIDAEPKRR